jgi:deoxyribodipyrimidine photo-lyase
MTVNPVRTRLLNTRSYRGGNVAYWMSRDQRSRDNWALLFAQEKALEHGVPLLVLFCLVPQFLGATLRQYAFMLRGLQEIEEHLSEHDIPFDLIIGEPGEDIPRRIADQRIGFLVTDFDPLRIKRLWKDQVISRIHVPCVEVDAHNIIPCWVASPKQEYAAYTMRPKIQGKLEAFLEPYAELRPHPHHGPKEQSPIDWKSLLEELPLDRSVEEVSWLSPGMNAAEERLHAFVRERLGLYDRDRNDPTLEGQSHLSPYFHFGNLSPQRAALEVTEHSEVKDDAKASFLEELIVRRELSDNFCYYNESYDSFNGLPSWARRTLDEHRMDARPYNYSLETLEQGETHDDLWNAAQAEMVKRGKMHGYMRMYWAKKILEWTGSPEEALNIAVYLNDRYELDGRDPKGYTGIAWSIGGVHDRAWGERDIFGKIRYMSYNGCKSKFDVKGYIASLKS